MTKIEFLFIADLPTKEGAVLPNVLWDLRLVRLVRLVGLSRGRTASPTLPRMPGLHFGWEFSSPGTRSQVVVSLAFPVSLSLELSVFVFPLSVLLSRSYRGSTPPSYREVLFCNYSKGIGDKQLTVFPSSFLLWMWLVFGDLFSVFLCAVQICLKSIPLEINLLLPLAIRKPNRESSVLLNTPQLVLPMLEFSLDKRTMSEQVCVLTDGGHVKGSLGWWF